jgi:DNA-directed RNA polymerase subunit RPC12/RpoP
VSNLTEFGAGSGNGFIYLAIYECAECHTRTAELRPFLFRFSRKARCPECGTRQLRRFQVRDHIERMSRHPLSLLQRLLGGRLYYCSLCRLQFHDWRGLAPELSRKAPVFEPTADL